MSGGKRPAIKMAAKLRGQSGAARQDIGAAWLNDDGRLGFSLAEGVRIQLADGSVVSGKGKDCTHFVDVFVNEPVGPQERKASPAQSTRSTGDEFADKLASSDDDQLPF